jgi:hypothetical protein
VNRWQREEPSGTPVFGPNGLRHFEQSLKAVADTRLPLMRQMEIVSQVDEYVLGFAEAERMDPQNWEEEWGDYLEAVGDYLDSQLEAGDFPHVEAFLGGDDFLTVLRRLLAETSADERFERGLDRILDGVQAEIDRQP